MNINEKTQIRLSRRLKCNFCDYDLLENDIKCPGCAEFVDDINDRNNSKDASHTDEQDNSISSVIEKVRVDKFVSKCYTCGATNERLVNATCCVVCGTCFESSTTENCIQRWSTDRSYSNDTAEINDIAANPLNEDENISDSLDLGKHHQLAPNTNRSFSHNDAIRSNRTNSYRNTIKDNTTWTCVHCSCCNLINSEICIACNKYAPFVETWQCDDCTFRNQRSAIECFVCGSTSGYWQVCGKCFSVMINLRFNEVCDKCLQENIGRSYQDQMKTENDIRSGGAEKQIINVTEDLVEENAECSGTTNVEEVNDNANKNPSIPSLCCSDDNDGCLVENVNDHYLNRKEDEKEFRNRIDSNRNCSVKSESAPQCHDNVTTRDRDVGNCEDDDEESLRNVGDMTKEICLQDCRENEEYNKCANAVNPMSDSKDLSFAGNDVMNSDHTNSIGNKVKDNTAWICIHCSCSNLINTEICIACNKYAPFVETWQCDDCTFRNRKSSFECFACGSTNRYWQVCRKCYLVMIDLRFNEVCDKCLQENIERSYQDQLKTENDIVNEDGEKQNVTATCDQIEENIIEHSTGEHMTGEMRDSEILNESMSFTEEIVYTQNSYLNISSNVSNLPNYDQESINEPRDSNEEITPLKHTVVGSEEELSPVDFHARTENKISELDASQNVSLHEYPCLHDSSESRVFSSINAEFIGSTNTDEVNDTANEDPSFQTLYYSDDNEGRYDHSWNYEQNEKEFRNSIDNNRNCSVKLECAPQCHDIVTTRDRDVGNCEDDDEESLRNVGDMTTEINLQSGSEGDTAGINDDLVMVNEDDNKCANVVNPMSDSKDLSFAGNDVMKVMNNNENCTETQISNENYNDTAIGEETYINGINPEFGYNPSKTTITTAVTNIKNDHDGNEVTIESCHTSIPDYEMVDDGYELISNEDFSIP